MRKDARACAPSLSRARSLPPHVFREARLLPRKAHGSLGSDKACRHGDAQKTPPARGGKNSFLPLRPRGCS